MQNLCYFLEKISFVKIYALCREIHFVAIYALLCGEKFIQKFSSTLEGGGAPLHPHPSSQWATHLVILVT